MTFSETFLAQSKEVISEIDPASVESVVTVLSEVRNRGGRLFVVGSGGGAGHASHAVCDFRKLCGFEAYSPTDNVSELTARVNDDGWDTSLANYLKVSRFSSRDALFVFSVGGGNESANISVNLVNAIKLASEVGASIVGIVGRDGGFTAKYAQACVVVPTIDSALVTPHTEGMQALLWHLIVSHPKLQINSAKWESAIL